MNIALNTILVAIDFSTGSRSALEQAARLAHSHHAKLHVLHIIDSAALTDLAERRLEPFDSFARTAAEGAGKALDSWIGQSDLPIGYAATIAVGAPLHEILEHVKSLQADLLVAGIAGAGENPMGAGSVSGKLARKSSVNVLLVRSGHPQSFKKIVACLDFSGHSHQVVKAARQMAQQDGASIDFLHVWVDPGSMLPVIGPFGESGLGMTNAMVAPRDELIAVLRAQLHEYVQESAQGLTYQEVLHEDRKTGRGIADHARESGADLVIIGALGRTNLRYLLLGSTAERVLSLSACSVLVVKPADE